MSTEAKIKISAEDKASSAFAALGRSADKLGINLDAVKSGALSALSALAVKETARA